MDFDRFTIGEYIKTKGIKRKEEEQLLDNVKDILVMPYFKDLSQPVLQSFKETVFKKQEGIPQYLIEEEGYKIGRKIHVSNKYIVLESTYKSIKRMNDEEIRKKPKGSEELFLGINTNKKKAEKIRKRLEENGELFLGINDEGSFVKGNYFCYPHINQTCSSVQVQLDNQVITSEEFLKRMSIDKFSSIIINRFKQKGIMPEKLEEVITSSEERIKVLNYLNEVLKEFIDT